MRPLGEAALRYARMGWAIFPLSVGSKKPTAGSDGVKGATTDEAQIKAWWAAEDYNIGLACGDPSDGIVVVDVDEDDADTEGLPETLTSKTAKGVHLYFRYRGELPNTVRKLRGLDTRATGGYVVLPPSVVESHTYTRVAGSPSLVADLPEWFAEKVRDRRQPSSSGSVAGEPGVEGSAWGQRILEGEVSRVIGAATGERNDTLFRAAANVYGAVKTGHIGKGLADHALEAAAKGCGLPYDETHATLLSAWHKAEPRQKPDFPEPIQRTGGMPSGPEIVVPSGKPSGLLTVTDLEQIKPPKWLIYETLAEGMTVLFGEAERGKSFVALDWSLSLAASGMPVVYCVGEGVAGVAGRVRAWRRHHAQEDIGSNFQVLAYDSFPRFHDPLSVAMLRQTIAQMDPKPGLIVVDTWGRALDGDDYKPEMVAAGVRVLDELRSDHGTNALVVHHPKAKERGSTELKMRGPKLEQDADLAWRADEWEAGRFLENTKAKDWERLPRRNFRLESVADPTEDDPLNTSAVVVPSAVELMRGAA